ncbi:MAG: choice-of-anchor L domain-containing protein [Methanococcaceae archaeon]
MKKKLFWFIFFAILLLGCKKDDNPVQPPDSTDITPPTITIQTPTTDEGYVTLNSNMTFEGTASDDQGLKEIRWSLNSAAENIAPAAHWSVPNLALQDGDNTFIVTCTDNSGNKAADTLIVTKNKNLTFTSAPQFDPQAIILGQPVPVKVTIGIQGGNINASEVKLLKLTGGNYTSLGNLLDNGDLTNGDDIANDGVYSAIINFTENTSGTLKLRVSAKTQGSTLEEYSSHSKLQVYQGITDAEFQQIDNIQTKALNKLNELAAGNDYDQIISKTKSWLLTQPEVSSVTSSDAAIIIKYKSGLVSGLSISERNAQGEIITKGGISSDTTRYNNRLIPLEEQTRGRTSNVLRKENYIAETDPDIILNKNVIMYAPFTDAFSIDMSPSLWDTIESAELGFKIDLFENSNANIKTLLKLPDYGLVIFDTHGAAGEWLLTGERVKDENKKTYEGLLRIGYVAIFKEVVVYKIEKVFEGLADVYGVSSLFISSLPRKFPRSVILNGSCESTMSTALQNAFIGKGAETYFGFNQVVNTGFCLNVSKTLISQLVKGLKTTGNSFIPNQKDPRTPYATFEMKGNANMYFSSGLINGDFEFGNLVAWSKEGDGRVITRLGMIPPTGSFMGIISTGLGLTTQTGSISQSFKIKDDQSTLSIRWNFLSEEFLEFINSKYQDYFTIILTKKFGHEVVLMKKTIDDIASDFGATEKSPGSLIEVSPGIKFDMGGVYMTNWQTSNFDVTPYRGQTITLTLKAGDVGDSNYDTAILLDDIIVQ